MEITAHFEKKKKDTVYPAVIPWLAIYYVPMALKSKLQREDNRRLFIIKRRATAILI
jgi:hypothetical protein